MALRLRSLLRGPKLRSGVKALVLALSFAFLPLWATGILALILYATPSTFMLEFLGTLVVLGIAIMSIAGIIPVVFLAAVSGILFFVLLGVKDVLLPYRSVFHGLLAAILFLTITYDLFSGAIALPVFAISVFLLLKDRFSSFTVLSQRAAAAAAVISLVLSEIVWAIALLGSRPAPSTMIISLFALSMFVLVHDHLSGDMPAHNSIFLSSALAVLGLAGVMMAAF